MKRRILILLVLVCAAVVSAQSPVETDMPAGVSVLKFGWSKLTYHQDWDTPRDPASNQSMEGPRGARSQDTGSSQIPTPVVTMPLVRASEQRTGESERTHVITDNATLAEGRSASKRVMEEYTYKVRIKNAGRQTIEAVDWEYLFLDLWTGSELARHRFMTFRRAAPGNSLTLSGTSLAPPTRVLNAAGQDQRRKQFDEKVVIKCVVYSDGSVAWRAAGKDSDCELIKNRARTPRH